MFKIFLFLTLTYLYEEVWNSRKLTKLQNLTIFTNETLKTWLFSPMKLKNLTIFTNETLKNRTIFITENKLISPAMYNYNFSKLQRHEEIYRSYFASMIFLLFIYYSLYILLKIHLQMHIKIVLLSQCMMQECEMSEYTWNVSHINSPSNCTSWYLMMLPKINKWCAKKQFPTIKIYHKKKVNVWTKNYHFSHWHHPLNTDHKQPTSNQKKYR